MIDDRSLRSQVKDEIRKRRRSIRAAMPESARAQRSRAITERLTALEEWRAAHTVLAFVSMRTEVQTGPAVEAARREGKVVVAPRLAASRDDLELARWSADDPLEESGMRFLQPSPGAERVDERSVDLVLVPALAADPRGYRIGFGGGFYDRLLPRLTGAVRVALIFDFERIAEVPEHDADVPVHIVVTDARVERVG